MKKQTYVTALEDEQGHMIDFERWGDKRPATVMRKLKELYSRYYGIYQGSIDRAARLVLYPTPDGYSKEAPEATYSRAELMEIIGRQIA